MSTLSGSSHQAQSSPGAHTHESLPSPDPPTSVTDGGSAAEHGGEH